MLTIIFAAILIGLIFAPLGCFVLWKRYVFFGDGLSHASILGVSISILCNISFIVSGIVLSIFFAILIFYFKKNAGNSAAISLISSLMLAIALICAAYFPEINTMELFLGDILSVDFKDILTLSFICIITIGYIILFHKPMALLAISEELALIQGIKVKQLEISFLILLSLAVFSTIKIVGALLVTSILVIPAMTAKLISNEPVQMIITAVIMGVSSNIFSIGLSFYFDLPLAPLIVLIGAIWYLFCHLYVYLLDFNSKNSI